MRNKSLLCAVRTAAFALLSFALPAQADINQFVQGMIASGTAPFGVDDASATNTDICTFDYAAYRVGYSITPSDANALIKFTAGSFVLPGSYVGPALTQAAFFDAKDLPTGAGGCQNISLVALTPAQITAGNVSGVTANGQTLYCVQPPSIGGNNLDFRLQIRGDVPNGTTVNAPTAEFSSSSNPLTNALTGVLNGLVGLETFYGLPALTVKASPKWNLNKSALRGGLYVPGSGPPGSGPGGVGGANGFVFSWNIGVYAIGSRKGLEALNTAGFTENWSDPDFPNSQLVTWNMQVPGFISTNITPRNCGDWRNALGVLGNVFDNTYYFPNDYANSNYAAFDYTVARGGICQSTAIDQVAKTATFSLTNTDWSLTYYPVKRGSNPAASNLINPINPDDNSNEWWVASKTILIWVPETDIVVPPSPNTSFLTNTANFFGISVTGQNNIEPVLTDNSNQQGATRSLSGGMVKVARPWFYLNNPFGLDLALRDPTITGDSQVHQIAPNQAVLSAPQLYNSGTSPFGAGLVCDKIDNTRFTLLDTTNPAYVGVYPGVVKDPLTGISVWYLSGSPSIGPGFVWELGINTVGVTGGTWSSYNTNFNEYAGPAVSGSAQSNTGCGDADAVWYPSVAALLAAGRTLQEVTTVRGKYANWPGSTAIVLGIPQIARDTFAYSSTDIGPGGSSFVAGSSAINTFSSNQARWETGIPGLFGDAAGVGRAGDTVKFFQTEYTQISKSSPTNPNNTLVTPGTQVTYALNVNITTSGSAHTATVDVWDVLPAGMDYVPGSSTLGAAPLADPVCATTGLSPTLFPATAGPPASAAGSVPAGYKACKWELLNQNVVKTSPNAAAGNLPELRFRAAVALNATVSPPVLLNTAFADSTLNQYADAVYGGAQIGFRCLGGQNCFFSNWSLSVAASPGIGLSKSVSRNLAGPDTGFSYTLAYGAVGSSLANPRILDVLPYVGDGRTTASAYAGTLGLSGPVVLPTFSVGPPVTSADPAAIALYTNNTSANINRDPYGPSALDTHHKLNGLGTNSATSTNWCTAAQFLTANCPSSFANVKGVMILPFAGAPSACGSAGTVPCLPSASLFQVTIAVAATANLVANVYSNDFRADSPSLTARAPGSNLVSTRIVAPDLILSKTVAPSTVNTGATVVYTLSPRNNTGANVGIIETSPVPTIIVTDNLPSNLAIANAASVDGGANWNCAASVAPSAVSCTYIGPLPVPVGAAIGNDITVNTVATSLDASTVTVVNTATIALSGQTEAPTTNNTALATLLIKPSFSDLVSIVTLPANAPLGSVVTGTVVFANIASGPGAITASNAVGTVTLSNGQILTYSLGNLAAGTSTVYSFTTTVPNMNTPLVANSNIYSAAPDNNPNNNASSDNLLPLLPDVSVTLVLPANAIAGTTVTATVTYSNIGAGTASNVIGTLTLSNGITVPYTLGTFIPGQTLVTTTVVTVPFSGSLGGTATVATSTPEVTLTNNQSTASLAVTALTDVQVSITAPTNAQPGQTITAVVVVGNAGPSSAQNVSVTVSLPNGSTTVVFVTSTLASGASTSVTVVYRVPPAQASTMTWTATVATTTPESNTLNNISTAVTLVQRTANAALSGRVWLDTNSDKIYTSSIDRDLLGWRVELLQGGVVVGTATTAIDGRYTITGQVPGSGYSVRFKNPSGEAIVSTPYNQGPIALSGRTTQNGNPSNGTTTPIISAPGFLASSIDNITLYANDNTIDQNLPIDPSGVVYDAVTRLPVLGAVVTLIGPNGSPVPGSQLIQGASSMTTAADGIYQFDLLPTAPSGVYTLQITAAVGYLLPPASAGGVSAPGAAPNTSLGSVLANGTYQPPSNLGIVNIAANSTPAAVGQNTAGAVGSVGTQYFLSFNLTVGGPNPSASLLHNHIPLDPFTNGALLISKVGDKTAAEVGDSVRYTIRLRNTTSVPVTNVRLEDMLPAGFRYILGTTRLNNAPSANPLGGVGRALTFAIGTISPQATAELSYFVRLGVGAQQGDGINRAQAVFTAANNQTLRTNLAVFKVKVLGGVFSSSGCIVGKVVVDCDANHIQNNESGSQELGIPGVRLVLLDGTYAVTDNEGKYSLCDVKPQTHVIKVDATTLPRGAQLLPTSNRNAGVGASLFVDLKGGELARADFIEGSCSSELLEQVKARRAVDGVLGGAQRSLQVPIK